jgi:DNA-binding MarR family transcriptional regulator
MLRRFEDFVSGIAVCHKYIQRIKNVEMTEFGLKGTHAMCIYCLHQYPQGLTAAQLCQLCAEDKAAISRTLAVLQERELISVGEKKYRARLMLTEMGEKLGSRIDELIEQWVSCGGDGLTDEERAMFYSTLDKIAANLKERLERGEK